MQTEFEVKIININVALFTEKLIALGATKVGEHLQRRFVYDFSPKNKNSWIRLRTNGEKTTLAIKEIQTNEVDGTKELEVEVSDFETTNALLEKLGYTAKGYQENRRISYRLNGADVEIDLWPKIPAYAEVEAKNKAQVEEVLAMLGVSMSQTTSVNTTDIYAMHGIDISTIKVLKF